MADDAVARIKEWRKKSRDHWAPVYDEFVEVQQALKCRTSPIMVTVGGEKKEDKSRTNVCMPVPSIAHRKNVARMTAQAPKIGYISAKGNKEVEEKLTSWSYWQYDVTGEAEIQRKHVGQAEAFGLSVTKVYQDDVTVRRKYRIKTKDASLEDLNAAGYGEKIGTPAVGAPVLDETGNPVLDEAGKPQRVPTDSERMLAMSELGNEIAREVVSKKYSGPCVKFVFIGDLHFPPGCAALDEADWVIEEYIETDRWLEYWLDKTFVHPDSGEELPVFDAKACDEMVKDDKSLKDPDRDSLRARFRELVKQDTKEPGKKTYCGHKFNIMECHEKREDGRIWIVWIGNDEYQLGEMPYPWDLYGAFQYTDLTPLPDPISIFGDSTLRLGRFLHRLHNAAVGQRTDLINQTLRPYALTRIGSDIPDEATERGPYRELQVKNPGDIQIERLPEVPNGAWENESAVLRMWAMLEPGLSSPDAAGTNQNPQTGKTATVGVLAQRERDTLLGYKIDALNIYLKKLYTKKLWILQQTMQGQQMLASKYLSDELMQKALGKQEGISLRSGKAEVISLDWQEIQEDLQVEPEAGSTLPVEDEFHIQHLQNLFQMAQAAPEVFDIFYIAKQLVSRMKGVESGKAVKAPQPPPAVPPKVSVSISVPFDKLPADVQNQLLPEMGLQPSAELVHEGTLKGVKLIGEAADGAAKLEEPVGVGSGPEDGPKAGTRKTLAGK